MIRSIVQDDPAVQTRYAELAAAKVASGKLGLIAPKERRDADAVSRR